MDHNNIISLGRDIDLVTLEELSTTLGGAAILGALVGVGALPPWRIVGQHYAWHRHEIRQHLERLTAEAEELQ